MRCIQQFYFFYDIIKVPVYQWLTGCAVVAETASEIASSACGYHIVKKVPFFRGHNIKYRNISG